MKNSFLKAVALIGIFSLIFVSCKKPSQTNNETKIKQTENQVTEIINDDAKADVDEQTKEVKDEKMAKEVKKLDKEIKDSSIESKEKIKAAKEELSNSVSKTSDVITEKPKQEISETQTDKSSDTGGKTTVKPPPKTAEAEEMEKVEIDNSQDDNKKEIEEKSLNKPASKPIDHGNFNKLLASYVSPSGQVNYKAFKSSEKELDKYLSDLSNTRLSELSTAGRLAFWINAYNAFTIKKILMHHPVSKITDLDAGKPWDQKWIKLDGKTLSLNNIENDIIRPEFKEPRIHFAVNCAAKSCPPILNKAWSGGNLNTFLEQQTKAFVNNPEHNTISVDRVKLSKIFDWYKEDFGDLIGFLNKYSNVKINKDAKIEFNEYNWKLNN